MSSQKALHLHTYFRSSCSARVRTAAHFKGIALEYTYINLLKNEQGTASYAVSNPSASVPTLSLVDHSGQEIIVRQSVAILEFFEEYFPNTPPLLPPANDYIGRARVRELVNIIANDVQPPTNLRILKRVKRLGGEPGVWAKELIMAGLSAYDKVAEKYSGTYSVGDEVTMADVVLAPAVEGALRYEIDLEQFPTVNMIYKRIKVLDSFRKGDWKNQEDTPPELRVSE